MFDLPGNPLRTTPSGLAFTGNAIVLKNDTSVSAQSSDDYPFNVRVGGKPVYSGRYCAPYHIDLSEVVAAFIPPLPDPAVEYPQFGPFLLLEDESAMLAREVFIDFDGDIIDELGFIGLPGAISKQNFRQMGGFGADKDIFTERFCAPDTNCFLTTRTAGWSIEVKETELYPLCCIVDYDTDWFSFVEKATGKRLEVDNLARGIYALDPDALRRYFFDEHGVLANCFEIYHRDKLACRLVIKQASATRERYRLKFRNSLGAFEIIELAGILTYSPEWEDSETSSFKVYDPIVGDYIAARVRPALTKTIKVNSGNINPSDVCFLMDMLGSDEVYLLDAFPVPARVIPEPENLSYRQRPETPASFTITLRLVDEETNIIPDIVDGRDACKPRVFSNQFSKQFN